MGAVAVVALSAGGAGGPAVAAPSASTSTVGSASSPRSDGQPAAAAGRDGLPGFGQGTARRTSDPSRRAHLVLTEVRTGQARRFDRVVLEFSGRGRPGYLVNYVDRAVVEGSGTVVDLGDGAVLDVYASGTTWPAPDYYDGPERLRSADGGVVGDVHVAGTFEGYTQVLAGIDGEPAPFRVFTLASPPRLVVDVSTRR